LTDAQQRLQAQAEQRAGKLEERSAAINDARAARGLPPRTVRPRPSEKPLPGATTNLTDPDSRVMLARHGRIQGYNAQWACTAQQIIVAAQVTQAGNDVEQLAPMLAATRTTLRRRGHDHSADVPRLATNGGSERHTAAYAGRSTWTSIAWSVPVLADLGGAPGVIRTPDTRFRNCRMRSVGASPICCFCWSLRCGIDRR